MSGRVTASPWYPQEANADCGSAEATVGIGWLPLGLACDAYTERKVGTMSSSAFWDDLNRDLEDPAIREEFVAATEEIAALDDAANAVSPEQLRARRNRYIVESSAEFGDMDLADVDDLPDEARRKA